MYCHNVITVKTEYSIRKFVSTKRWPKRIVQARFFFSRPWQQISSYWTGKNRPYLVKGYAVKAAIHTRRCQMCEKRLA